jgi:Nucleoside phosphorylase
MHCIMVAMEKEAAYLLSKSSIKETKQAGFAKIMLCSIGHHDYVLAVSGIGKGFASSAMEAVALLYPQLQSCINIGVAGSLDVQRLPLFSSIIASSLVEHDLDTSAIGDPKGLVSGINLVSLPVDEAISLRLVTAAESVGQHPLRGVISSGDTFYADPLNKERIHQEFHSLATDMEAAPMAQIAYVNHLPFASLRTISDAENNGLEYAQNAEKAAKIAGEIAEAFLLM